MSVWRSARLTAVALFTKCGDLARRPASFARQAIALRYNVIREYICRQTTLRTYTEVPSYIDTVQTGSKRPRSSVNDDSSRPSKRRSTSPASSCASIDTIATVDWGWERDEFGLHNDPLRYRPPPPRKKPAARDAAERRERYYRRQRKVARRSAAMSARPRPKWEPLSPTEMQYRTEMTEAIAQMNGLGDDWVKEQLPPTKEEVESMDEAFVKRAEGKAEFKHALRAAVELRRAREAKEKEEFDKAKRMKRKRLAKKLKEAERIEQEKRFFESKAEIERLEKSLSGSISKLEAVAITEHETPDDKPRLDKYGRYLPPVKKIEKKRFITPLSAQWEDKVRQAMAIRTESAVIGQSVDGVELSRKDLGRVLPGEPWLNDEVVNAWYANLCARLNEKDGYVKSAKNVPKYAAYQTAWYKNVSERGATSIQGWSRRKGIKGEKLLETERIFFPTNTGAHWTLLTISGKNKTIEYLDSMKERGWAAKDKINMALAWLRMELGNKFVEDEWTVLHTSSAQQNNMNDCGVFACLNGWALVKGSADPSAEFAASEIPMARQMLAATLINGGFTGDFDL